MLTSTRSLIILVLGIFAALEITLSAVQASQDGRGRGRGAADEASSQQGQFFRICDHDGSGWVSFREANFSLRIDRTKFRSIDTDADGRVSSDEFGAYYEKTNARVGSFREPVTMPGSVSDARSTATTGTGSEDSGAVMTAGSIKELFGARELREERPNTVPLPPRIQGPVAPFIRLDIDDDGQITSDDLEWLARPIHLDVRFPAVSAILDTDHDGGVSPAELRASMR